MFNKQSQMLTVAFLTALPLTTYATATAHAQGYRGVNDGIAIASRYDIKEKQWKYKRNPQEFQANDMTQLPDLPGFPSFTGSRPLFLSGEDLPNIHTGRVVNYRFAAKETPDDVADWYRSSLAGYGWEISRAITSRYALQAKRGRDSCQIVIMPASKPGYRSDVIVLYQLGVGHR